MEELRLQPDALVYAWICYEAKIYFAEIIGREAEVVERRAGTKHHFANSRHDKRGAPESRDVEIGDFFLFLLIKWRLEIGEG